MKRKKHHKQCGAVVMSPIVPFIGIILFIIFLILLIISLAYSAGKLLTSVCIFFCLISIFMILTINQRIDYTPEGFVYRDMLRISHKYSYSQVTKIRYSKDVLIYVGYRIILIDSMASNGKKFARIASQYSPNAEFITDSQVKLFNGNVSNPGEFVFVYVMFVIIPLLFLFWTQYGFREISLDELQKESTAISDYYFIDDEDENNYILIEINNSSLRFKSYYITENSENAIYFKSDVNEKKIFDIYYEKEEYSSEDEIKILQLSCNKNLYIALSLENENNRQIREEGMILSIIIFAFVTLYIIISSYIMRNAEKYPRLIKAFVRSNYIIKK